MKSLKKIIILPVILLGPAIFYFFLNSARHNVKKLDILGPKFLDVNGDTVYHTIPDFEFINQFGKKISQKDLDGKIYVADFIFTTCQTICPKMSEQMSIIQEKVKDMPEVTLISHTVDPEYDSVPVLLKYAERMGAIEGKWHLLTGEKKKLYAIAREGYLVTAIQGDGGPRDFIHSEKMLVIDKMKKIRGFYDGTDPLDVKRLIEEIKVLQFEDQVSRKNE